MRHSTLAVLTALLATSSPAAGDPPADRADTEIQVGQTITGRLESTDPVLYDGKRYDAWTFRGRSGDRVSITMGSDEFDAYLTLLQNRDGQLVPLRHDDDGAGGTDSRVYLNVVQDAEYVIYASAFSNTATGSYTLAVEPTRVLEHSAEEVLALAGEYASLSIGAEVTGTLTSESPVLIDQSAYGAWSFEGHAGEVFDVEMVAEDFDAYLQVGREGGASFLGSDDDGADGTNSLLNFELPEDGRYVFIASAFGREAAGDYTLRMRAGEPMASFEDAINTSMEDATAVLLGNVLSGTLDDGAMLMTDRTRSRMYVYHGRAGERITVTLRSSDFDAYLGVGRPAGESEAFLMQDDDSGGGTDARLTLQLPEDGPYGILVNTLSAGEQGRYTLHVQPAGSEPVTMTDPMIFSPATLGSAEPVGAGHTVIGALDESSNLLQDGSRFDAWRYSGTAGERVTVRMRSEYFDAFLKIGYAGAPDSAEWDDDGAGGTDARISTVLQRDGELVIVASSLSAGEGGRYTLTVEIE